MQRSCAHENYFFKYWRVWRPIFFCEIILRSNYSLKTQYKRKYEWSSKSFSGCSKSSYRSSPVPRKLETDLEELPFR